MMNMELIIGLIIVAIAINGLYFLYKIVKDLMPLIINSVAGIIVFFLLNFFLGLGIPINIWTVAAVAIGGFIGLLLVLIVHFLGIAF